MFDSWDKLLLGLITGVFFGFLLQKGRVAKFHVIVGQLLLKDWTVLKIMMTAIVVGAIGVYALVESDSATLHIRPFQYGGILLGAALFGSGMAVLGYCPGTSVAACGEGRRDAMVGVLGMFTGAAVFVLGYPLWDAAVKGLGSMGEITIPQLLNVSPWLIVGGVTILVIFVLVGVEFFERRGMTPPLSSTGSRKSPTWRQRLAGWGRSGQRPA